MSPLQFRSADARNIELLRGLRPQDVDSILKSARQRRYSARTVMTHQVERIYGHQFPLIMENAVVVATDRHIAWHLAAHVALCSETARERVGMSCWR